jgi:mono/diheme cytochrome c family protein
VLGKATGILFTGLVLCLPMQAQAPGGTPLSERAQRGRKVFDHRCYVCHQKDSDRVKEVGPSLDGLFKRPRLITGKPVTTENVKEIVTMGPTPNMPAFRYTLSEPEIDDVIEYLQTK